MEQTIASTPARGDSALSIAAFRTELGLTLAEMGERVGLSKSQMHFVEQSNTATVRVAVALEEMSVGRIDAAALCEDVRVAREGLGGVLCEHAQRDTSKMEEPSPGQNAETSGESGSAGEADHAGL